MAAQGLYGFRIVSWAPFIRCSDMALFKRLGLLSRRWLGIILIIVVILVLMGRI